MITIDGYDGKWNFKNLGRTRGFTCFFEKFKAKAFLCSKAKEDGAVNLRFKKAFEREVDHF